VGISALYRRYANKEDLLRQVARDGLAQYLEIAEAAVADDGDAWETFVSFMARLLDAQTFAITMTWPGRSPRTRSWSRCPSGPPT
jgi:AcrR family transcriptional regulator